MKYDVFISYSRKDLQQVEPFVKSIEREAYVKCWIDWTGIISGSNFEDVIVEAIDSADVVLFFLSENSIKSPVTKEEIVYAYNTNKKVVPIVLDGRALRGWFLFKFGSIDYIDITDHRQCEKLYRDLKDWCTKTTTTPLKTYKVGDYYDDGVKQGVVFDVSDGGRHGKIVSLDQIQLQWCTKEQYEKKIVVGASSDSDGKANTDKVMACADSTEYPAFKWCRVKGQEWYMPSAVELKILYQVKDTVNKTLQNISTEFEVIGIFYLSSTEMNKLSAWGVHMLDGHINLDYKYSSFNYVRAVATF